MENNQVFDRCRFRGSKISDQFCSVFDKRKLDIVIMNDFHYRFLLSNRSGIQDFVSIAFLVEEVIPATTVFH